MSWLKSLSWPSAVPFLIYVLGVGGVIALLRLPIDIRYAVFLTALIAAFAVGSTVFLLPRIKVLVAAMVAAAVLWFVLDIANELKSSAVLFPLTMLDVKFFFANPTGLLASVGAPGWTYAAFNAVPYIGAVALLLVIWIMWRRWRRENPRAIGAAVLKMTAKAVMVAVAVVFFYGAVAASVESYRQRNDDGNLWNPEGLAQFSRSVGIFGFLVYSNSVDAGQSDFFTLDTREPPPGNDAIMRSAGRFLDAARIGGKVLPNIMIVHAESTFDLNDVLKLKTPVDNSLFYTAATKAAGRDVQLHGPLLVNTMSGSSWITEFEILLGMDSRLFGASGRYTHASLSGYAQATFPRYLKKKGYELAAYSADSAAFYGYGKGYLRYGFDHFYDQTAISKTTSDIEIMSRALQLPPDGKTAPFLKVVLLAENHSPHPCNRQAKAGPDKVELDGAASLEQTCAVNEYARRARSTETAIAMALDVLRKAETETGKPYVLAVYGDHQPFTFTGGGGVKYNLGLDFSQFYKDPSKRKTIFKLYSSKPNPIRCCWEGATPVTLVSSLISAYAANSINDLYLPVNFYQFDKCGSDWVGTVRAINRGTFSGVKSSVSQGARCPFYESLLTAYRQAGVIGYAGKTGGSEIAAAEIQTQRPATVAAATPPRETVQPGNRCTDSTEPSTLTVFAAGTDYLGPPEFRVVVDGMAIGQFKIKNAPQHVPNASQYDDMVSRAAPHQVWLPTRRAAKEIEIEFINDKSQGKDGPGDRNLWIKSIEVAGRDYPASELEFVDPESFVHGRVNDMAVFFSDGKMRLRLSANPKPTCG